MDTDLLPLLIGGGVIFLVAAGVILSRSWGNFGKPPALPTDIQPMQPRAGQPDQWGQQANDWQRQERAWQQQEQPQRGTYSSDQNVFAPRGDLLPIQNPQMRQSIDQMMSGAQRQRYERYLLVDQGQLYLRLDQVQPQYRQEVAEIVQQLNSGGISTANPLTMIKMMAVLAKAFR